MVVLFVLEGAARGVGCRGLAAALGPMVGG